MLIAQTPEIIAILYPCSFVADNTDLVHPSVEENILYCDLNSLFLLLQYLATNKQRIIQEVNYNGKNKNDF